MVYLGPVIPVFGFAREFLEFDLQGVGHRQSPPLTNLLEHLARRPLFVLALFLKPLLVSPMLLVHPFQHLQHDGSGIHSGRFLVILRSKQ